MRRLLLVLALILAPGVVEAQRVRVDARVAPGSARVGDVVTLEITVSTPGPEPLIGEPSLPPGLRLTGSSDFSAYQFSMPGGRQRTTRRELALTAAAPGHYVIPPLAIRVGGEIYRTPPVRVDVSGSYGSRGLPPSYAVPAAPPAPSGAPGEEGTGPGDEVLLQAWASPDTVYVGEQVTVRTDALFSLDVRPRLAGPPQYDAPSAPGFWVYELPGRDGVQYRPVRGRMYEVQTFRRAFFPLTPGRFFLPAPHLTYSVRRGFLSGPESYELRADSIPVVVRPLPEAGKPADFAGAVGRFTGAAHVDPASVGAGEAATLTVEVRGDGNIKAVPPPRLPAMSGVEVYPPAEDADVRPDEDGVAGVKRFSWVLVPSRPGRIAIPALELPYFDPGTRRYFVARTQALTLAVGPGTGKPGSAVAAAAGKPPLTLRPLHTRDDGAGVAPWLRSPALPALLALPLVAGLALLVDERRRRTRALIRPKRGPAMLERLRQEMAALRAKASSAEPDDDFAAELLDTARAWLADRLGAPPLATTAAARLDGALRDTGVRAVVAAALAAFAGRLEQARFLPVAPTPAERVAWVDEAERLLAEVHAGTRRGRRAHNTANAVLMALGASLAGGALRAQPAAAPPASESAFAAGVRAYDMSQYSRATELFSGFVSAHPDHAAGWYDLGNASYRAGRHGRAVWAWLRALELRPRDEDVRQNLAVAGVDPDLVDSVTPAVAMSSDELLLAAALLWLVGAMALVTLRLARRTGLLVTGIGALVIAAVLGGMGAAVRLGPVRAIAVDAAPLLAAPTPHADVLGQVAEGAPVRLVERRGVWARVRLDADDNAGTGTTPAARDGWVEAGRLGAL